MVFIPCYKEFYMIAKLDIEIYEKWGGDEWAQAKYLVHGYDDVFWTNNIDEALQFLKDSCNSL